MVYYGTQVKVPCYISIHAYKSFISERLAYLRFEAIIWMWNVLDISYSIQANIWNIKPGHWKREKMGVKQPYSL